jgi:hypothetical protein
MRPGSIEGMLPPGPSDTTPKLSAFDYGTASGRDAEVTDVTRSSRHGISPRGFSVIGGFQAARCRTRASVVAMSRDWSGLVSSSLTPAASASCVRIGPL